VKRAFILATFLMAATGATDQPYELKGEAPGMTLKQFKANHKHADCSNLTSRKILCRVYDDTLR
jgi:hypothetical protein